MRTKRTNMIILTAVVAGILIMAGCGFGASAGYEESMSYDKASSGGSLRMAASEPMAAEAAPLSDTNLMVEEGRKKILTADISIEVEDLQAAEMQLTALIQKYKGWVDRSSFYATSMSLTLRVPADQLDAFLQESGELGDLYAKSISADDVTDYYFDTEARLETLYILKERYTAYLQEAGSMEDILTIERELNTTIAEIESMERTMRRLDGQITYSTVYFYAELPPEEQVEGNFPNFLEGLKRLGYGFISLLYYIGIGLLYAIIFGIPIILVLGLIYWVGWGRIGLVRKFFRLLSRNRSAKKDA